MGIETVAIYAKGDESLHVSLADQAVCIEKPIL